MASKEAKYINGYHPSVLRSHNWRTVENSAAYLIPYLRPDMHILDVGCGPGTITADFARLAPQGQVVGLEHSAEVLDKARENAAERGLTNIKFSVGDIHKLDFPDNAFDLVHAHQVLQHVGDPVKALSEMRRVTKPGGFVAVREGDFANQVYYPEDSCLEELLNLHATIARSLGGEPNAGRRIVSWAMKAGFLRENIKATASAWCYSSPKERAWWGDMWAERTVKSGLATSALEMGLATQERLEQIADALRKWAANEDGWYALMHGEILCTV